MNRPAFAFIPLFICLATPMAHANCNVELFRDSEVYKSNLTLKLMYLKKITKEEWEDLEKAGNLDALINGMQFGANYEEMKEWQRKFESENSLDIDTEQATSFITSKLSEKGLRAYQDCLLSQSNLPVILTATDITRNMIVVKGRWRASAVELPLYVGMSDEPIGAERVGSLSKTGAGDEFQIRYKRTSPADPASLKIVISFKNGKKSSDVIEKSAEIFIPEWVQIKEKIELSSKKNKTLTYDASSGSETSSASCSGSSEPGYNIVPDSINIEEVSRRGNWQNGGYNISKTLLPSPDNVKSFRIDIGFYHNKAHAAEQVVLNCVWHEERKILIVDKGQ